MRIIKQFKPLEHLLEEFFCGAGTGLHAPLNPPVQNLGE